MNSCLRQFVTFLSFFISPIIACIHHLQLKRITMNKSILVSTMLATMTGLASPLAYSHCGGAFCTMNTNWDVQGVWDKPGVRLDLRAEFINLDQLRAGNKKASPAGLVDTHDETRTLNRNFVGTLDWSINDDWGITFRAPLVNRAHNHIHNIDDGAGGVEAEPESWKFNELGDLQAIGRYAAYQSSAGEGGFRFGFKLPTGNTSQKNSAGELAERSLQPGTGSTDAMVGAYYHGKLSGAGWFAQGMWQQTINEKNNFRPGRQLSADLGLNYAATPALSLMAQLNLQHKTRDTGVNAEPADSGGYSVFLTPGVSYRVAKDLQLYGFLQKPIYQHVNGTQLTADWSVAAGISKQF